MATRFFSAGPVWEGTGLSLVRILVGAFMIYHGWEVFEKAKMDEYTKWMVDLHYPAPEFMAYLGKSIELAGGIFFLLGLFTRLAIIPLAGTMLFITFLIGHGNIFMNEQHPFLFVVIFIIFFFTGPGTWSLDNILFKKEKIIVKRQT